MEERRVPVLVRVRLDHRFRVRVVLAAMDVRVIVMRPDVLDE